MRIAEVEILFLSIVAFTMLRVSVSPRSVICAVNSNSARRVFGGHRESTTTTNRP